MICLHTPCGVKSNDSGKKVEKVENHSVFIRTSKYPMLDVLKLVLYKKQEISY